MLRFEPEHRFEAPSVYPRFGSPAEPPSGNRSLFECAVRQIAGRHVPFRGIPRPAPLFAFTSRRAVGYVGRVVDPHAPLGAAGGERGRFWVGIARISGSWVLTQGGRGSFSPSPILGRSAPKGDWRTIRLAGEGDSADALSERRCDAAEARLPAGSFHIHIFDSVRCHSETPGSLADQVRQFLSSRRTDGDRAANNGTGRRGKFSGFSNCGGKFS